MYRVFKTLVRRFHSQTNPQKYGTIGIAMPNGENNKTVWNYPMVKSFASDGHIWSYCACWWNLNIQNPHCRLFCVWNFPCLLLKSPCVLVRLARSTVVSSWSLYFFLQQFPRSIFDSAAHLTNLTTQNRKPSAGTWRPQKVMEGASMQWLESDKA